MPDLVRVLMVEDVADDAALVERELRRAGITGATRRVDSEGAYREALRSFAPDIILTDHSLPTFGAADALRIAMLGAGHPRHRRDGEPRRRNGRGVHQGGRRGRRR